MTRYQRKALALQDARDDARAAWNADHEGRPSAYRGHTPHTIDGRPTFAARVGGFQNRVRAGRSERTRGGGLRFVRDADAPVARAMVKPDGDA